MRQKNKRKNSSKSKKTINDSQCPVKEFEDGCESTQQSSFSLLHLTKPSSLIFVVGILLSFLYYKYNCFYNYTHYETITSSTRSPNVTSDVTKHLSLKDNDFPSCNLYVAKSTIKNSGLGIFTATDISAGKDVGPSDVIVQLPDLNPNYLHAMKTLMYGYLWDGQEFGGQYEGQKVFSFVPGVGMLANGHEDHFNIIQSPGPSVDTAGLYRSTHPGAGANSHYWNYTFRAHGDIPAGSELFVDYGENWFRERNEKGILDTRSGETGDGATTSASHSIDWLRENGICLDNIQVGPSTNPAAGRGAFATRSIAKGQIVAPAPVVQITDRRSLETLRVKTNSMNQDEVERSQQLLLNYCFGHRHSSLLFIPIAPVVNFINHDSDHSNVELRWSTSTQHDIQQYKNLSIQDLKDMKHAGLMLEFVATKDIQEGDEIFLNYGTHWEEAWRDHVSNWQPIPFNVAHEYASIYDMKTKIIPTQREKQIIPENLFTSCYYQYRKNSMKQNNVVTTSWNMMNVPKMERNLRPCIILDRRTDNKGETLYTVGIRNRYGLLKDQRIPPGETHILTHVPRSGIKFTSKLFTSDQSLPSSFRHEIHLPDDIFPRKWLDL